METRYYLAWIGEKLPFGKVLNFVVIYLCLILNNITFVVIQIKESGSYGYAHFAGLLVFYFILISSKNNIGIICKSNIWWIHEYEDL